MKQTIGQFLLRRLEDVGIRHIFGVPGDFNLELMQQLEELGHPEWVGNCNELNAAYAADGYARLSGLSALIVTNGVGALSAINGVAGAFSEHVPVICICGSLPLHSVSRDMRMHHTLADGSKDVFFRIFQQVTAAQAKLTPENAVREIDRLIVSAWRLKLPVYLELPSDIAYLEISVPEEPLTLIEPDSDRERLRSLVDEISTRLRKALAPAILLDLDADRYGVLDEVETLAEKRQIPVATLNSAKATFCERSGLYAGIYSGAASPTALRTMIESSDCLIAIGYRRVDSTSGFFSDALPGNTIHLYGYSADFVEKHFEGIVLRQVLEAVIDNLERVSTIVQQNKPQLPSPEQFSTQPLTQAEYWGAIQRYLRSGDVILAEDGTSSSGGTSLSLPMGCSFVTQAIWGSIGYTLGALLGTLLAAPERRHILLIGDGSFQLTAQELSTILRHDLKPKIFLINNSGYTIERTILGKEAKYNDIADWKYARLAEVFSTRDSKALVINSEEELEDALAEDKDDFLFLEVRMRSDDAPKNLIRGGHASANVDYGPRGPQSAPNAQITLEDERIDPGQSGS